MFDYIGHADAGLFLLFFFFFFGIPTTTTPEICWRRRPESPPSLVKAFHYNALDAAPSCPDDGRVWSVWACGKNNKTIGRRDYHYWELLVFVNFHMNCASIHGIWWLSSSWRKSSFKSKSIWIGHTNFLITDVKVHIIVTFCCTHIPGFTRCLTGILLLTTIPGNP